MEKAYIAIVLDKSGSMNIARDQTISGFNEQVQTIKANLDPNIETIVSLITFNSNVAPLFLNKSAVDLEEIDATQYIPNGGTALFDAIGFTIDTFEGSDGAADPTTSFLAIVISDGEENSSTTYFGDKLASKIKELEESGRWTFTYMGAVNPQKFAASLNIAKGNIAGFSAANAQGFSDAYASVSNGTQLYMASRSAGVRSVNNFYAPDLNAVVEAVPADSSCSSSSDSSCSSGSSD